MGSNERIKLSRLVACFAGSIPANCSLIGSIWATASWPSSTYIRSAQAICLSFPKHIMSGLSPHFPSKALISLS